MWNPNASASQPAAYPRHTRVQAASPLPICTSRPEWRICSPALRSSLCTVCPVSAQPPAANGTAGTSTSTDRPRPHVHTSTRRVHHPYRRVIAGTCGLRASCFRSTDSEPCHPDSCAAARSPIPTCHRVRDPQGPPSRFPPFCTRPRPHARMRVCRVHTRHPCPTMASSPIIDMYICVSVAYTVTRTRSH
ncbi:hypothetical protein L226DRAFT_323843 [Lentinus tigrinus ALCF2SS1-7]|uniref:uncharacterized protein n=1 Tax=Lentinus tigrinus ALCF2SS1-7 TaxID=1328758 RepID=UPI001165F619|nr:hypothetical protein L226DRAFT_323843 [Lentinus tigrinus ALCF2SS1-7]